MTESEPAALPLGYAPGCLVWLDWLSSSVVMVANYCQQVIAQRLDFTPSSPAPGRAHRPGKETDLVAGAVVAENGLGQNRKNSMAVILRTAMEFFYPDQAPEGPVKS